MSQMNSVQDVLTQLFGTNPGDLDFMKKLAEPFPNPKNDMMRPSDGFRPRYVEGVDVINRLNTVAGIGWSFEVGDPQWMHNTNQPSFVFVKGRLSLHTSNGTVSREQYGQCMLQKHQQSGLLIDPGSDLKAAATDALKKCATLFGVGLELYAKDETPMQGLTKMVEQPQQPQQQLIPGQQTQPNDPNQPATPMTIQMFRQQVSRTPYNEQQLCQQYGVQSAEQMSEGGLVTIMNQICGVNGRAAR